ncbi:MAG: hypothetical protein IH623_21880 [Verrucomicrobia bacterium]|nr:hypothetical protein [Verrucomicrobiota bacterium]
MHDKTTAGNQTWRRRKRAGEHRDVARDARTLGCHRSTLWRVLSGKVNNPVLFALYQDLIRLRGATTNKPR